MTTYRDIRDRLPKWAHRPLDADQLDAFMTGAIDRINGDTWGALSPPVDWSEDLAGSEALYTASAMMQIRAYEESPEGLKVWGSTYSDELRSWRRGNLGANTPTFKNVGAP